MNEQSLSESEQIKKLVDSTAIEMAKILNTGTQSLRQIPGLNGTSSEDWVFQLRVVNILAARLYTPYMLSNYIFKQESNGAANEQKMGNI